jgi:hypothetical protein
VSREVRRVPLDWKHPTEPNPYWVEQSRPFMGRPHVPSKLRNPTERFVGLIDDYPGRLADWEAEVLDMKARQGHGWTFAVQYHLTGYQGREDSGPVVHPFYGWTADGMTETKTTVRDEDHLYELEVAKVLDEKPNPDHYMPTFDGDDLGWCLYETVSEGTPVTPVFATAAELIDHLATVGQDWLNTRQPTGKPPWPILLLAGAEKAGKSYSAAEASASNLIGRTLWVGVGEDDPDEYGALPGARFEIVEHDGTYRGILAALTAALRSRPTGKPNLIVLDSATRLWDLLCDEQQVVANRRARVKAEKYNRPVPTRTPRSRWISGTPRSSGGRTSSTRSATTRARRSSPPASSR